MWRVRVGTYANRREADEAVKRLAASGYRAMVVDKHRLAAGQAANAGRAEAADPRLRLEGHALPHARRRIRALDAAKHVERAYIAHHQGRRRRPVSAARSPTRTRPGCGAAFNYHHRVQAPNSGPVRVG